jgi:hypothetical protein
LWSLGLTSCPSWQSLAINSFQGCGDACQKDALHYANLQGKLRLYFVTPLQNAYVADKKMAWQRPQNLEN